MPDRPPSRRVLGALAALGIGAIVAVSCSSGDATDAGPATTTTTVADLNYTAFSDPAVPVTVEVRRRFAIMLPADPANGWRWVVEPVDTAVLAPLGSEFLDDPALLARATTTTTAPPPEDTTTTLFAGPTTSTTAPPTTEGPTTTTTAPGPLVQVVSYAGRRDGQTTVTLRYERIGTGEAESDESETVVFQVIVGTPPAPPPDVTVP